MNAKPTLFVRGLSLKTHKSRKNISFELVQNVRKLINVSPEVCNQLFGGLYHANHVKFTEEYMMCTGKN